MQFVCRTSEDLKIRMYARKKGDELHQSKGYGDVSVQKEEERRCSVMCNLLMYVMYENDEAFGFIFKFSKLLGREYEN